MGDGDGHLAAIRTAWKFDELLSSSVLVDFDADRDGKLEPAELQKVAGTILGSSREHGYFTFLKQAGAPVAMGKPDQVMARFEDGCLKLFLEMRPERPISLSAGPLSLLTYDPTYYVSFDVAGAQSIALTDLSKNCSAKVTQHQPNEQEREWLRRVAGFGKAETLPSDGINFARVLATNVTLDCP